MGVGQQVVEINFALSEPLPIVSGIPHGSILAPLLFSIYTNDLTSVPMKYMAKSYVHDTKLVILFDLKEKMPTKDHIEEDLLNVCKWCCQNYLLLNPDKTKLVFASRQKIVELGDFKISLLRKELLPVPSGKDLDVILDNNLSFDDQSHY